MCIWFDVYVCNFDVYVMVQHTFHIDVRMCNFELYECGSIYIFVISMYIYTV